LWVRATHRTAIFVKAYEARIRAVANDNETQELVACVRAGMTLDAMLLTPTERRGFLQEYGRQEKLAYEAAKRQG